MSRPCSRTSQRSCEDGLTGGFDLGRSAGEQLLPRTQLPLLHSLARRGSCVGLRGDVGCLSGCRRVGGAHGRSSRECLLIQGCEKLAAWLIFGLGARIAAYRRRRGLSQAALAGLIGRSESWLSQVERGIRSVDRLSVLLDLASVLRIDVEALIGRPWQYAPNGQRTGWRPVRGAAGADQLHRAPRPASRSGRDELAELRARVAETHRLYQAARYDDVIGMLPGVLSAVESFTGRQNGLRRESLLAYVSAYVVAAKLVTKLGAGDLAILAADRAANAAADAGSLAARGMAGYQVACALLRADQPEDAERLAVSWPRSWPAARVLTIRRWCRWPAPCG